MSNFEKVTVEEVVQRVSRAVRTSRILSSSSSHHSSTNSKSLEHRISTYSKPSFKSPKKHNNLKSNKKTLTPDERSRIETLIASNGGRFIGHSVLRVEWNKMAVEKGLCKNCIAKGHIIRDCPLLKRLKAKGERDQLAALIDSQMETDLDYLCALAEDVPLFLFPCIVQDAFGVTFLDDGATRNYVSLSFAKRAKLRMQEVVRCNFLTVVL
jgi:hypothetical protein